ncbi:Cof-type HAD-IIB family hydrolase [Methylobacterium marchantiae]|uniref:Cof-type HAD-IIB family hydrolase n=1 Tax=Methylobacterium marchantiae TaxID=600331 RepID=A0ABW3X056_9HYPH|nr:Putative phosphatase [Methylobacterium marchantiae]
MTSGPLSGDRRIAFVISDVDGTLVTSDKVLTRRSREAVRRLEASGIGFTIASARPPMGLTSLIADLDLRHPIGAFNGSTLIEPDGSIIAEHLIPEDTAREAVRGLGALGLDIWVFAKGQWNLRNPHGAYTDLERRTLRAEPTTVADLAPLLDAASKIVGVSADADHLAACESRIAEALGNGADVHRSQAYYLDVTPHGQGKGSFVDEMARRLGIPRARIATLGDAANDVPMFARSGFSVAMGNAGEAVKRAASTVTATNDDEGFAEAVEEFFLTR